MASWDTSLVKCIFSHRRSRKRALHFWHNSVEWTFDFVLLHRLANSLPVTRPLHYPLHKPVALQFYIQIFVYPKMLSRNSTINLLDNNRIPFWGHKSNLFSVQSDVSSQCSRHNIRTDKKFSTKFTWDPKHGGKSDKS